MSIEQLRKAIKQFFCWHKDEFVRNLWGNESKELGGRSVWRCPKCEKEFVMPYLNDEEK